MPLYEAEIVVDNPDAEGAIDLFGLHKDWYHRVHNRFGVYGSNEEAEARHDKTEYIEAVRAVKPAGWLPQGDMVFATGAEGEGQGWWRDYGDWRRTRVAVLDERPYFADMYNADAGATGIISTNWLIQQNFGIVTVRSAPPKREEGDPPRSAYTMVSYLTEGHIYEWVFPIADKTYKYPFMLATNRTTGYTDVLSVWQGAGGSQYKTANEEIVDELWFELLDGAWVIRRLGVDNAWVIRPRTCWPIPMGRLVISIVGLPCKLYAAEIEYPATSSVTARPWLLLNDQLYNVTAADRTWHNHAWKPNSYWNVRTTAETGQTGELDRDCLNACLATYEACITAAGNDPDAIQACIVAYNTCTEACGLVGNVEITAKTTFSYSHTDAKHSCPLCYVATMKIAAHRQAANSSAVSLTGSQDVQSLSYSLNARGRGQSATISVRDTAGSRAWKGQELVTVSIGKHGDTKAQKFEGHIGDLERTRDGSREIGATAYISLPVQDPIDARLAKKYMAWVTAAGGDNLARWVYDVLYNAGEPASRLTDILAMIGTANDPVIPLGLPQDEQGFAFDPTAAVPDAFDQVVGSMGREWGWNAETGQYFLRVRPSYGGTADWTLDDDTATAADFAWMVEHTSSREEFRNYLLLIVATGGRDQTVLWPDQDSHLDSSASNFVGCDLWEVIRESDMATGLEAAWRRWNDLGEMPSRIRWSMTPDTSLGPSKFVQVQVSKMNITTDAIYRIVEEEGDMPDRFSARQTLTAELYFPLTTSSA